MKVLKYLLLGIGFILMAAIAPALGACIFLGFLIIGGLDAIGLIHVKMDDDNKNTIFIISGVVGVLLFGLHYLVKAFL